MSVSFRAITPKRNPVFDYKKSQAGMDRWLSDFIKDIQSEMSDYPAARSPDWRRTGTLGRGWTGGALVRFGSSSGGGRMASITNPTRYGRYVQGNRQREYHKQTGWKNIKDVGEKVKKKRLPALSKLIIP